MSESIDEHHKNTLMVDVISFVLHTIMINTLKGVLRIRM